MPEASPEPVAPLSDLPAKPEEGRLGEGGPGAPTPVDPLRRLRLLLVGTAVLAALAIAAAWIDARNDSRDLRVEMARRFKAVDEAGQESAKVARGTQDAIADLQSRLGLLEDRLAEAQSQQAALEELYRELTPGRDDWTIAEVEQVLLLASQQLQLAGNVRGALTALQLADGKLQRLDRPQFVPLRRALGRDMDRLKALPYVDIAGITLRIDQTIAVIERLPLAIAERVEPAGGKEAATEGAESFRLLRQVWADLKQMVRIQDMERDDVPLLLPAQEYYLRENLRMRLLSARVALLSRDEQTFRADLKASEEWLRRYFDVKSKATAGVLLALKQIQATEVPTELPDLNASLEAVRSLKAARDRSPR
jgi:uroporphyrin-3 C-methyltransferase